MEISAIGKEMLTTVDGIDPSRLSQSISHDKLQNDFSTLMTGSVNELNQAIVDSDTMIEKFALGRVESVHEVIIAMEKAKMSLQVAVEVRNKLVDAYQEIIRMSI